jgi:uncharacterized membrane protein
MDAELSSSEKVPDKVPANITANSSGESPENVAHASVSCPHCGSEMPVHAAFCPACGWSMTPIPLAERAAAAIAYLTLVPAVVILFLPAFRNNRFVRFHAWQSVLLWAVFFVLTMVALFVSNVAAAMVFLLFGILISLAMLFLWIVLTLKAWQGERFELPVFGDLAARLR